MPNCVCRQARAVRLINAGKIMEGCKAIAFGEDGKYYKGLHNRRVDEMKMCMRGGE
jgi:GH24 family phage-related lysozyme (muramidase)